jgi:hypothetical protein
MKPGVLRVCVAGMAFNISFFKCLHMFVCKIFVVIIHNRSSLFFLLNKYCTEGKGSEMFHLKISNSLRVGIVFIFFGLIGRRCYLLINFIPIFFAVTKDTAAPSFNCYPSTIILSHRRPASADVSRLTTIK